MLVDEDAVKHALRVAGLEPLASVAGNYDVIMKLFEEYEAAKPPATEQPVEYTPKYEYDQNIGGHGGYRWANQEQAPPVGDLTPLCRHDNSVGECDLCCPAQPVGCSHTWPGKRIGQKCADCTPKKDGLSEEDKKDWICEKYNGSWELWIDPAALYDALHPPSQSTVTSAAIQAAADSLCDSLKAGYSLFDPSYKNAGTHIFCAARDCVHAAFAVAAPKREVSNQSNDQESK